GFQALINMGVNVGLLPTKGLTLPLMSYGGSGLVVNCVSLAILLRIDWENRQLARGVPASRPSSSWREAPAGTSFPASRWRTKCARRAGRWSGSAHAAAW